MKECPVCKRTYDDSWEVCLFCEDELKSVSDLAQGEQEGSGLEHFSGSKFSIIVFTLFLMFLTPLLLVGLYIGYYRALEIGVEKHEQQQLEDAVVFDEDEKSDKDKKEKGKK